MLLPFAVFPAAGRAPQGITFLTVPALIYLAVAMASRMNIGVRHILPIFPFLFVLAGWAAAKLIERRRSWAYIVAMVLVSDVVSSLRAFPVYIAYANELWGGPASTYEYLSDSTADWAQQLEAVKKYLDSHGVKNCWFAYFAKSLQTLLTTAFPANRSRP